MSSAKWRPFCLGLNVLSFWYFHCFLNKNIWISFKISLKFVSQGPSNNIPALVEIMVWRRSGDKPLSETMTVNLLTTNTNHRWIQWIQLNVFKYIITIPWGCRYWLYIMTHYYHISFCYPAMVLHWYLGYDKSSVGHLKSQNPVNSLSTHVLISIHSKRDAGNVFLHNLQYFLARSCKTENDEVQYIIVSWWRHQMETFSALLAFCAGNSPNTSEFPSQRPITRSFDVFFDLRLNKRLSIQAWGRRTHYDVVVMISTTYF